MSTSFQLSSSPSSFLIMLFNTTVEISAFISSFNEFAEVCLSWWVCSGIESSLWTFMNEKGKANKPPRFSPSLLLFCIIKCYDYSELCSWKYGCTLMDNLQSTVPYSKYFGNVYPVAEHFIGKSSTLKVPDNLLLLILSRLLLSACNFLVWTSVESSICWHLNL